MKIAIVGSTGFVGSAFQDYFARAGHGVVGIGRDNYAIAKGDTYDLVINASNNSKKYISDRDPLGDFDLSVTQQMRVLHDFPAPLHVLLSSVDVYSDLEDTEQTRESVEPDIAKASNYGFHKLMAEQCVRHYAPDWLIVRLAGMVGPHLKKNPVFDIQNGQPLRIHPDSQYQFMHTGDVASIVAKLIGDGFRKEVFNVCGAGLVSPRQIGEMAGKSLDLSQLPSDSMPRILRINNDKVAKLVTIPHSEDAVRRYLNEVAV